MLLVCPNVHHLFCIEFIEIARKYYRQALWKKPKHNGVEPGRKTKIDQFFARASRSLSPGHLYVPGLFRPALVHSVRSRDLACSTALGRKIIRNKKLKRLWTNYVSLSSFAITFIILIDWVSYVWQINVWFFRCSWFKYTLNWVWK